jgi:hypothetical protein
MPRYLPTKPGWYRNPDDPRSLRYWDGTSWSGRSRPQPPWWSGSQNFLIEQRVDRSSEGPVHPRPLREPVASGAWSNQWLPWRPRHAGPQWGRAQAPPDAGQWQPPRSQPPLRLGPARRPLLAMVALVVVAVAVVVSSVAFIAPYGTRPPLQPVDLAARYRFDAAATRQCQATLPQYRQVLARGGDGRQVDDAAYQVDLLRRRLAAIPVAPGLVGLVEEWFGALERFTQAQRRYAAIVGRPVARNGHLVPRPLSPARANLAQQARASALTIARQADTFSSNLSLASCRLDLRPVA